MKPIDEWAPIENVLIVRLDTTRADYLAAYGSAYVETPAEARRELQRTLVIVASDHGESLGEHGEDGHGIFVCQSTLQVPLIMRVPGLAPSHVADVTRVVDVMPTVLDLHHRSGPSMNGESVVALMTKRVKHLDLERTSWMLTERASAPGGRRT